MVATLRNTYKSLGWCLVQISTLLIATPTHLTITASGMFSPIGHTACVSPPVYRQPGAVDSSNERRTRRHARDFSHVTITYTGDISSSSRSTPREPNVEKELPRIPSTSTGLWDAEPATVSSEMMTSPVISTSSLPPLPVSQNLRRMPTTEAQKIAARYRRRYGSLEALRSEVSYPPKLKVSSFLVSVTLLVSPTHLVDNFSILRKLMTRVLRQVHARPPLTPVCLQDLGPNLQPAVESPVNART